MCCATAINVMNTNHGQPSRTRLIAINAVIVHEIESSIVDPCNVLLAHGLRDGVCIREFELRR